MKTVEQIEAAIKGQQLAAITSLIIGDNNRFVTQMAAVLTLEWVLEDTDTELDLQAYAREMLDKSRLKIEEQSAGEVGTEENAGLEGEVEVDTVENVVEKPKAL